MNQRFAIFTNIIFLLTVLYEGQVYVFIFITCFLNYIPSYNLLSFFFHYGIFEVVNLFLDRIEDLRFQLIQLKRSLYII